VAKTSNYWDKRAVKRLTDVEKHSEKYINRVKRVYNQAYKDIDRELASIYRNYSKETGLDTQKLKELLTRSETQKTWEQMKRQGLDKYIKDNYKSRISRLEQLQAQIYAKAKMIYPKEELQNTLCYKGVINESYYKTMYDTQMGTGYAFNFATIDNNMIDALLQDPWSGANYSQRIWGNTDILADSLSEILGGAMLSGQSMELTAKQIRDRFNVSKYYAERLIRTETNHFNNEVDAMAYEEMGLDKYVFVATLDSRTSEICQLMDNKVFKFTEREAGINYPPLHPNCRSKTRAYLGAEEEKNLQRRARNPQTGKTEVIDNISYKDWIKQYSTTNRDGQLPTKQVVNASKRTLAEPKSVKIDDIFGGGVKLNGVDVTYQKEIGKEFSKIYDKYPIDLSTTQLKTNTATRQIGHSWNCIKGGYDRGTGRYKVSLRDELVLNKNSYKDKETSIKVHNDTVRHYKKPYSGDLSTLWHEYGHQIDDKYCMAINSNMGKIKKGLSWSGKYMGREEYISNLPKYKEYNNTLRRDNMSKRVWEQLYDVMKNKNNGQYNYSSFYADIREYLGSYATTDNKEFLAEGFTAMNLIPKKDQSEFVKEFAKIFDAEFDKVLRR
jgi:SPP1 gp7 family putative phage head morphogenesis protein